MGQALRNPGYFTVEEYLAYEKDVGERHEYVDGVIYSRVGGTDRHNLTSQKILIALDRQMPSSCRAFVHAMKLRIKTDIGEARYSPDIMACCDEEDRDPLYRERPCVLVEVLSPSTEPDDRQGKFQLYKTIPTLEHCILVAQDVPQVEAFARRAGWKPEVLCWGGSVAVCDGRATLAVDDIYEGISFSDLKPGDF